MIYMDYNATTPCDPRVAAAMRPWIETQFANPSSIYRPAREARAAIDAARASVAGLLSCAPEEVFFTSGGSESDNWAVKAAALARLEKGGGHIVTSAIEHHAVLNTCGYLKKLGFEVTAVPVDAAGVVDLDALRKALRDTTVLVTIMHANNEIGTIQPIAEICRIAGEKGVPVHTDAVQTAGKYPLSVGELGVAMLSLSAHKFHGPKGVGALYVRKGFSLPPYIHGGEQERGRRAGTENVAGIVGLGEAARIARAEMAAEEARVRELRDLLESAVRERIPELVFNGHPEKRLYNTCNVCVRYVEGESLLLHLDFEGICASSGSACTSGSLEPSHVLLALGLPHETAHGSLRFSLGRYTTREDVERVAEVLPGIVEKMRKMSPFWNAK